MLPFLGLDAITLLTTLFWVWMLIDCLFNKQVRGGSKVFWFLLIFFTQFVGALIYYFVACSQRNPVDAFTYYYRSIAGPAKQQPKHYQQTPTEAYPGYQQGYQARQQAPMPVVQQDEPQPYQSQPQYDEQPMASYPEMPQQQ